METFLECWKISKYYSKIVWEFILKTMIRVSENSPISRKRNGLSPKKTTKVEKVPIILFDLNQIWEKMLTENCSN